MAKKARSAPKTYWAVLGGAMWLYRTKAQAIRAAGNGREIVKLSVIGRFRTKQILEKIKV